jgi:hypothetical protein
LEGRRVVEVAAAFGGPLAALVAFAVTAAGGAVDQGGEVEVAGQPCGPLPCRPLAAPASSRGAMNRACQTSFSTLAIRRMPSW